MEETVVGNVQEAYEHWQQNIKNETVLEWIKNGVTLTFSEQPKPFNVANRAFNFKETVFINKEIDLLLKSKCIVKCSTTVPEQYISAINVVRKRDSFRLVTDLRILNQYSIAPKFCHESELFQ